MSLESSNKRRRLLRPESGDVIIIPPEIFADEILPRLPATNLQSTLIKLVCKDWLNLISSPKFIRRQLLLGSDRSIRILVPQANGITIIDYDKHRCVSSKVKEVLIPFPPEISFCEETPRILGSCDGLVLLANKNQKREPILVVVNPSTGKSELFPVPEPNEFSIITPKRNCYWFGHHPATGEYVLVMCEWTKISLHSFSRENKLRAVQSCSVWNQTLSNEYRNEYRCQEERGVLLDGVLYWPAQWTYGVQGSGIILTTRTISGYHIEDNKYFEISLPSQSDFKLGVMDGCLLSVNKRKEDGVFEVWVMTKETRVWTKYRDIEGGCDKKFMMLSLLSFFHNGDIIMEGDGRILTRYDFNCNKATFLNRYHPPTSFNRTKAIVCADSLVSPSIVMEVSDK